MRMRREEIRPLLEREKDLNRLDALARELASADPADLYQELFTIAVNTQWDGPALIAALLLVHLEPPCDASCEDAIRAMLPNWDVSIEEVPAYLVTQFGKRQMLAAVASLRESEPHAKPRLDTLEYWLAIPTEQLLDAYFRLRSWARWKKAGELMSAD